MKKAEQFLRLVQKYSWHPEFIGIEIAEPNQRGAVDDTLLHVVSRKGDVEGIEILISSGAFVNIAGDMGNTPLHAAAMAGQMISIERLLALGADPNVENEFGESPLDLANQLKHEDIARILLSAMSKKA